MLRHCVTGLALILAGAAPALAADKASPADQNKVICRWEVPTGSMMARGKLCKTRDMWQRPASAWKASDRDYEEETLFFGKLSEGAPVEVGSANWAKMPALAVAPGRLPYSQFVDEVEEILLHKQCTLDGQSSKKFDIEVPFAVQLAPDGKANRIVVGDIGCRPIESLVGVIALARSDRGDFRKAADASPRWFGSKINFTLE